VTAPGYHSMAPNPVDGLMSEPPHEVQFEGAARIQRIRAELAEEEYAQLVADWTRKYDGRKPTLAEAWRDVELAAAALWRTLKETLRRRP